MKLRLFPQENAGLDLLSRTAGQLLDAAAEASRLFAARTPKTTARRNGIRKNS